MKRLVSVPERVAEIVAQYGTYKTAYESLGFQRGELQKFAKGREPRAKTLIRLGLKAPTRFERA
jgi:hypothetical protein